MKLKENIFIFFVCIHLLSLPTTGQNNTNSYVDDINSLNDQYYQSINKNPENSLIYARKAFSYFNKINNNELKFKITANYATALYINELYKEALTTLDQIGSIEMEENNKALYFTLRGLVENDLSNILEAEANYKKALNIYVKLKDIDNEFTVLNNLGALYNNAGDYKKSLESYLNCFGIINDLKFKVDRYKYYMNTGIVKFNLKKFDNALDSYFLALKEAENKSDTLRIFKTHEKMAQTYVFINKPYLAIDNYLKALNGSRKLRLNKDVSDILLQLGNLYNQLGRKDIAIKYFHESLKVAHEFSFLQGEFEASLKLAIYYKSELRFDIARSYYNMIIQNKAKVSNIILIESAYRGLYQIEKQDKNLSLSLANLENYLQYYEETQKQQMISLEDQIETQYNLKQKGYELENLNIKYNLNELSLKSQQERLRWLIIFSILMAFLLLLILILFFHKRKAQKLLFVQNEQIKAQNEELILTNKKIIKKRKELTNLNQLKDQFLSIIAHDVKSPITDLYNLLFILRHNLDILPKEDLKNNLTVIESSTSNLLHLLNNILNWTISQSSGNEVIISEFSVAELINSNLKLIESSILSKELIVELTLGNNPYVIKSDLNIINFAIRNILSNAVKFSNKKGFISIKVLEISDSKLEIHIADSGIGFNSKSHILDENSKRVVPVKFNINNEKGYGIGLSLCQKMLSKIDSKITYQKNEPSGSIFILHANSVNLKEICNESFKSTNC